MKPLKVVELFAGVGGFRLGLEGLKKQNGKYYSASSHYENEISKGYEVVWSNQWEPSSKRPGFRQEANMVYHKNWPKSKTSVHNDEDLNLSAAHDMTDASVIKNIPNHDLLVGGFPCQDYSVAGVNTKGLEGKKGVLWWNIHKILKAKRPNYVFLENVDRLLKSPTSDRGRDFAIMLSTMNKLGYSVEWKVINAADYGMPQRRRRVYILAYHKDSNVLISSIKNWTLEKGIFASTFPSLPKGNSDEFKVSNDPIKITEAFDNGKFLNSGTMKSGKVWMTDFDAQDVEYSYFSKRYRVLEDVLQKKKSQIGDEFFIDELKKLKEPLVKVQLEGFELDKRLKRDGNKVILENEFDKWIYLKGRKAEHRESSKGIFYYKEGPLSLTDSLKKPSRTIITSEGGPGASRFKHLIEKGGQYRRLVPIELERLNMFPDDHTKLGLDNGKEVEITAAKRAFFMGNALVIGVVEKVGIELTKRVFGKI